MTEGLRVATVFPLLCLLYSRNVGRAEFNCETMALCTYVAKNDNDAEFEKRATKNIYNS